MTEGIERRDLSSRLSLYPFVPLCTPRSPSRWAYTVMYTVIQLHRAVIIHPGVSRSLFYCSELIKLRITAEMELFSLSPPSQIFTPFSVVGSWLDYARFVIFNFPVSPSKKRRFCEIR